MQIALACVLTSDVDVSAPDAGELAVDAVEGGDWLGAVLVVGCGELAGAAADD